VSSKLSVFMVTAVVHVVDFKRITYMESHFNDLQTKSVVLCCHLNQPYPIHALSFYHTSLLSMSSCHSSTAYTCWLRVFTLRRLQTTGQTVALCRLCHTHMHTRTRTHWLNHIEPVRELGHCCKAGQPMSAHIFAWFLVALGSSQIRRTLQGECRTCHS